MHHIDPSKGRRHERGRWMGVRRSEVSLYSADCSVIADCCSASVGLLDKPDGGSSLSLSRPLMKPGQKTQCVAEIRKFKIDVLHLTLYCTWTVWQHTYILFV